MRVRWLLLAAVLFGAACGSDPQVPETDDAVLSCDGAVVTSALPDWARAGFTPADQAVPHVTGQGGDIVGVVFGDPLLAPPGTDHANKILWVSRVGVPNPGLSISARLGGSDVTEQRYLPDGPGPSYVDMPTSGCWTFPLEWAGHTDPLAVPYRAP